MIVHQATGWALADHLAFRDYLESHDLLSVPLERVPDCQIEPAVKGLGEPRSSLVEKKRALVFLAHHRSIEAREALRAASAEVGAELARFARFAFEEASQWAPPEQGKQVEWTQGETKEGTGWLA
ncbi:MAG: hypothetical protein ACOX6T_22860 [Myxococcales bacterium]